MTKAEMTDADARAAVMNEAPPFEAPNLDGMLIEDLAACERVFDKLALYCHQKRLGAQHRLRGDIEAAQSWERSADDVYGRLPKWAQW